MVEEERGGAWSGGQRRGRWCCGGGGLAAVGVLTVVDCNSEKEMEGKFVKDRG